MWAVWGIVQAKEDLERRIRMWKEGLSGGKLEVDFDYLSYSLERITLFRDELKKLGIK